MATIMLDPTRKGAETEHVYDYLSKRIVDQEQAVRAVADLYQTYVSGLAAPGRPLGSLLLLGPTGTGKTRVVEATAECLLGTARAMTKIDCAEFQHSHEIAKLIGSPPGYLGHRETHAILTQESLDQYHSPKVQVSIILFDEIEKASDALWNLLLGILDKATLTLGDNRKVDFSRALIFMTSNLGAAEMSAQMAPRLGFAPTGANTVDGRTSETIARVGLHAARRKFTPEFINRLDRIVSFQPLGEAALRRILAIELDLVQQRITQSRTGGPFVFTVSEGAKQFLLNEGTDLKYGARHLKRAIERLVVQPMSNLIATNQVRDGDLMRIEYCDGASHLSFHREAENLSMRKMMNAMESRDSLSDSEGTAAARSRLATVLDIRSIRRTS